MKKFLVSEHSRVLSFYTFLFMLSVTVNVCFSLFAPFLPIEMEKKGYDSALMGPVMATYNVSYIFASLNLSRAVRYLKRRHFMAFNLVILGLSMVLFAFLMRLSLEPWSFYALIFTLRFIQGLSCGSLVTLSYSLVVKLLDGPAQSLGMNLQLMAAGIGVMAGPVLGGYLYREIGYEAPFLLMACASLLLSPFVTCLVPKQADLDLRERKQDLFSALPERESAISAKRSGLFWYRQLLSKPRILLIFVVQAVLQMTYIYLEPIMAIHFQDHYKMPLWLNNSSFAILPVAYVLGAVTCIIIAKVLRIRAHEQT